MNDVCFIFLFKQKNKNKNKNKTKREWLILILKWLVNNKILMMGPTKKNILVIGIIGLVEIY